MESSGRAPNQGQQPCHTRQSADQLYLNEMNLGEEMNLEELFDSPDVMILLRLVATREFLSEPSTIERLISYTLTPFTKEDYTESRKMFNTTTSTDELPARYRYAYLAAEVLSADITGISTELMANQELRNKLFKFVDADELNPWLALKLTETIFKVMKMYPQNFITFVHDHETVKKLVRHIVTPPIGDLVGNILGGRLLDTTSLEAPIPVDQDTANKHSQWWIDAGVFTEIIALISRKSENPDYEGQEDEEACIAGFQFLSDLIKRFQFRALVPYVSYLISPTITNQIISLMLKAQELSGNSTLFQEGALYIISLTERLQSIAQEYSPTDTSEAAIDEQFLRSLQPILQAMPKFCEILQKPGPMDSIPMSWGLTDTKKTDPESDDQPPQREPYQPLGAARIKVAEMMLAVAQTGLDEALNALITSGVMAESLSLFHKYDSNSILHWIIQEIIKTSNLGFVAILLVDFQLTEFIIRCNDDNEQNIKEGKPTKGYMGSITAISEIVTRTIGYPLPPEQEATLTALLENPRWEAYCQRLSERLDNQLSTNWPGPRCRGEEESEEDEEESEPEAEHVAYSDGVPNEDSNTPESKYALRQSPISRYHDDMSKEEGQSKHDSDFSEFQGFSQEVFGADLCIGSDGTLVQAEVSGGTNNADADFDMFDSLGTISDAPGSPQKGRFWSELPSTSPTRTVDNMEGDSHTSVFDKYAAHQPAAATLHPGHSDVDIVSPADPEAGFSHIPIPSSKIKSSNGTEHQDPLLGDLSLTPDCLPTASSSKYSVEGSISVDEEFSNALGLSSDDFGLTPDCLPSSTNNASSSGHAVEASVSEEFSNALGLSDDFGLTPDCLPTPAASDKVTSKYKISDGADEEFSNAFGSLDCLATPSADNNNKKSNEKTDPVNDLLECLPLSSKTEKDMFSTTVNDELSSDDPKFNSFNYWKVEIQTSEDSDDD